MLFETIPVTSRLLFRAIPSLGCFHRSSLAFLCRIPKQTRSRPIFDRYNIVSRRDLGDECSAHGPTSTPLLKRKDGGSLSQSVPGFNENAHSSRIVKRSARNRAPLSL